MMKKVLPIFMAVIFLASCAKPLYYWGNYNEASYKHLKDLDNRSKRKLLDSYAKMIEKAEKKSTRQVPPPGVYADYGFLLIEEGRATQGERMLEKEIELYPESAIFIALVLKMINGEEEEQ
ncbi:MAG: DUF4810 domain-containing protein [Cryomorphaceae bacterium]|nr:DUF4810 domain-containing protein [Cryomorphaceae bacterium]